MKKQEADQATNVTAEAKAAEPEAKAEAEAKAAEEETGAEPTAKAAKRKKRKWSFETVSKCPRCGTTDTLAHRTDSKSGKQYRQCQRAICRRKYTVLGKKV
jgi:hypothetical protein